MAQALVKESLIQRYQPSIAITVMPMNKICNWICMEAFNQLQSWDPEYESRSFENFLYTRLTGQQIMSLTV